jgi:uncharacterized protein YkwD
VNKKSWVLRAVLCAALLASCAGCADTSTIDLFGPHKPKPAEQMPALETRIYEMIEAERLKIDPKAKPLARDAELAGVAKRRSAEMAKANSFANPGGDRHVSATMLMNEDAKFQGLVGENVAAQHYTAAIGIDVNVFAQRFVDGWLASAPHKENLSFPDYDRTGVGAAVNGDTIYVTQLFSTDLGLGPHSDSAPPSQVQQVASPQKGKDDDERLPLRGAIAPGVPSN